MFSLADIDGQIAVLNNAAEDLESKADQPGSVALRLESIAYGLREAARSLERMIQRAVEYEAREAMKPCRSSTSSSAA